MMPGMNGRQFLQALRDEPGLRHVPVLIMTAVHGLDVNLATLGASEVVEKPFNVDELLNKVALAVYRSRDAPHGQVLGSIPIPTTPARRRSLADLALDPDRGVVLVVEHDRGRLQQLDVALRARLHRRVDDARARPALATRPRAPAPRDPPRSRL